MRNVTLALVALIPLVSPASAAPIPAEILTQCEKEFGDDLQKQVGCIQELVGALTKFREQKATAPDAVDDESERAIGVVEKTKEEGADVVVEGDAKASEGDEEEEVAEEPVTKPAKDVPMKKPATNYDVDMGEAVADFNFRTLAAYCEAQLDDHGNHIDSALCEEEEINAAKNLEYAASKYEGDIPGSPLVTCRNFVGAYQPVKEGYYLPNYPVLKCLKSKVATRVFADCFTRYSGWAYSPKVQSVPVEAAGDVATCFRKLILKEG